MPDTSPAPVPQAPVRAVRVLLRLAVAAAIGAAAVATLTGATAAADTGPATTATSGHRTQVLQFGSTSACPTSWTCRRPRNIPVTTSPVTT
jgi:hypothetical protein